MKPGSRETIPTVSEAVRDAVAICDPAGGETAVRSLFESFEDDDRPVTAVEDLGGELLATVRGIDPDGDDPAAAAAAAAALWIATNPDQADNPDHVLREGSRLAFDGHPPAPVADWLAARRVEV